VRKEAYNRNIRSEESCRRIQGNLRLSNKLRHLTVWFSNSMTTNYRNTRHVSGLYFPNYFLLWILHGKANCEFRFNIKWKERNEVDRMPEQPIVCVRHLTLRSRIRFWGFIEPNRIKIILTSASAKNTCLWVPVLWSKWEIQCSYPAMSTSYRTNIKI
jgi:hypothetical protein